MENPYTLAPNERLKLQYRVVLHRGDVERAAVERRYAEYAAEPAIELLPAGAEAAPPHSKQSQK